jgi:hypothetical protein
VAVCDRFMPLGGIKEAVEVLWVLRSPENLVLCLGGRRYPSPVRLVCRPMGGGNQGRIHFDKDGIAAKLIYFVNGGILGGRMWVAGVIGLMMVPHRFKGKTEVPAIPAFQASNELETGDRGDPRRGDSNFAIKAFRFEDGGELVQGGA